MKTQNSLKYCLKKAEYVGLDTWLDTCQSIES